MDRDTVLVSSFTSFYFQITLTSVKSAVKDQKQRKKKVEMFKKKEQDAVWREEADDSPAGIGCGVITTELSDTVIDKNTHVQDLKIMRRSPYLLYAKSLENLRPRAMEIRVRTDQARQSIRQGATIDLQAVLEGSKTMQNNMSMLVPDWMDADDILESDDEEEEDEDEEDSEENDPAMKVAASFLRCIQTIAHGIGECNVRDELVGKLVTWIMKEGLQQDEVQWTAPCEGAVPMPSEYEKISKAWKGPGMGAPEHLVQV